MVPPRKATSRRPPVGSSGRWCSKSPTTAWTSTPGYSSRSARWRRQHRLVDVEGHEAGERPGVAQRVEQQPGLLRRAAAQLDEGVARRSRGDLVGARGEDSRSRRVG